MSHAATIEKEDHGQQNARAWYESICELVAALECDYERLEELRDGRADLAETLKQAESEYIEAAQPADITERQNERDDAAQALADWDEENGEELAALTKAATLEGELQEDAETVRERIQEGPLSVEVREGWHAAGDTGAQPEEFRILLTTGGPALQIRGELDEYMEPSRAWLEYQDWGTPWTQYFDASQDTLLTYCRQFYFGE